MMYVVNDTIFVLGEKTEIRACRIGLIFGPNSIANALLMLLNIL